MKYHRHKWQYLSREFDEKVTEKRSGGIGLMYHTEEER